MFLPNKTRLVEKIPNSLKGKEATTMSQYHCHNNLVVLMFLMFLESSGIAIVTLPVTNAQIWRLVSTTMGSIAVEHANVIFISTVLNG